MNPDDPIHPGEGLRAATHRERVDAIEELQGQITTLEEREPELRKEIVEFEKSQRATIAELEKTQRAAIAELEKSNRATIEELEKSQRATIAELEQAARANPDNGEELDEELARTRSELADKLTDTRSELAEELATKRSELAEELNRTRTELAEELAGMRAEFQAIAPSLIDARCKLGMKMSDFALAEDEGHEQAIEYLKPLLVELRNTYRRVHLAAEREAEEAKEQLSTLEAEHHDTADAALPLVEQRFQPLIEAEVTAVTIEQANVRVARHQLALADPNEEGPEGDLAPHLVRELELEAALDELDAARAKVTALQEEKRAAAYHYSHPTAEKSKRLGEKVAKRFGRHH
jgi:DNA repair exonuclease SbcCD ATPase subunit